MLTAHLFRKQSISLKRLAIALLLCGVALSGCERAPDKLNDLSEVAFSTLTGQRLQISDIKGPLLVNFWATDCAICLKEMPDLTALYELYQPQGFELIAVAMPYDAPNLVLEMAEREQWPFPVALDLKGEALASFATVIGTPTSYLFNEQGVMVKRYVGEIPIPELKQQLNQLLELS